MPTTKRYQTDKQAVANLANALMELPDNWVLCRDMRHAWEVLIDFHVSVRSERKVHTINRVLRCLRCETLRNESYVQSSYGLDKVSQSYTYPDNYQLKGVPRGVKPQAIIQNEQFRRSMERVAALAREE